MARKQKEWEKIKDPFDRLLVRGYMEGKIPAKSATARKWFRERARKIRKYGVTHIHEAKNWRKKSTIDIGKMYFYSYDPKHKKTLPYYDAIPLVFFFNEDKDHLYGINLHYAPLKYRAAIMDALYNLASDDRFDDGTKLRLSWSVLKSFSKAKEVKPCVKSYLKSHVKSKFIEVESSEWDLALFMPIQDWRKSSPQKVYADYRRRVN